MVDVAQVLRERCWGCDERKLGAHLHRTNEGEKCVKHDLTFTPDVGEEVLHSTHAVDASFHLTHRDIIELGHLNSPSAESRELPSARGYGGFPLVVSQKMLIIRPLLADHY
jgi:hypothetical protein